MAAVPYEAWSEACDGTEQPQVYWRLFRADQVRDSNQRARVGAKIVTIVPSCQSEDSGNDGMTWTDAALADLVRAINQGLRDQAGYSGWQSGATRVGWRARADYGHAAMRAAYQGLAGWIVEPTTPTTPAALALPYNTGDNPAAWRCRTLDGKIDAWVVQPEYIASYQSLGARGPELLGLPISGMAPDRDGKLVQWFGRCRMELHGAHVALGLIGAAALRAASASDWGEFIPKVLSVAEAVAA